jgi:hypothetical protein
MKVLDLNEVPILGFGTTTAKYLFTVAETGRICRMKPDAICRLVRTGVFTPAVVGKSGRHRGHRISAQQLYGLAFAMGVGLSPFGCTAYMFGVYVETFGSMSEDTLAQWVGMDRDARTEEAFAAWSNANPVTGNVKAELPSLSPEKQALVDDIMERWEQVNEAVRKRMGLDNPRITE